MVDSVRIIKLEVKALSDGGFTGTVYNHKNTIIATAYSLDDTNLLSLLTDACFKILETRGWHFGVQTDGA